MNRESNPAPQVAHAPHAPLTAYYTSEQERAGFVRRMFDSTAADYDRMERILGFGKGSSYRGQALERAGLRSGMRIVDVGVGTGLVAREAVRIVGNPQLVVGVDPSPGMMASARLPQGVSPKGQPKPFHSRMPASISSAWATLCATSATSRSPFANSIA